MVAARAGDEEALRDLVSAYLPMVYTLVRRGLTAQDDVDDVVQDAMIRAVRELPALRGPESFRPWLVSITLRQIATHESRSQAAAERSRPLDDAAADLIVGGDVQDAAVASLEVSRQRRQIVRAGRWLDPDDRLVLSLWWLETADELSRAELAEALGVSVAHAGVRVQRMRDQLGVCRAIESALDNRPRCGELELLLVDWDGAASSVWRKRLARHVRDCPVCGPLSRELVAPERLLIPFALLPVPFALAAGVGAAALLAKAAGATGAGVSAAVGATGGAAGGGVKAGVLGHLTQLMAAHPVVTGVAAAVVVTGTAVTATTLPIAPAPERPAVVASDPTPTRAVTPAVTSAAAEPPNTSRTSRPAARHTTASVDATPRLQLQPTSLQALSGEYIHVDGEFTYLTPLSALRDQKARQAATFEVVRGLADKKCFTFVVSDGRFLRHASFRFRANPYEDWDLYRSDATFCVRKGAVPGSIMLESSNYHGWFLHRRGNELWIDRPDGSAEFPSDSSFRIRGPLV